MMDIPVSAADALVLSPETIRPGQLAKLFRRKLWLIGLCCAAGAAGAGYYAWSLPKYYTATTAVAVEGDRFAIPELQGALRSDSVPDPMPWVRTELQALSSRDLLLSVIDKLGLYKLPEFDPAVRTATPLHRAIDTVKRLLPARSAGTPASPDIAALERVSKSLSLFNDNRSLVINVAFTAQDPKLAAAVANTLVADYVAVRAKRRATANQEANATMMGRIEEVRRDLSGIEQKMHDLRSKGDAVGLRAGSVGQQELEELAKASAQAGMERAQLETTWTRAVALTRQGSSDALASVLDSPTVSRLREQEAQAARLAADMSSRYGPDHPSVRAAAADLASARRQLRDETQRIVASLDTRLRVAREHENDVQQQLAAARHTSVASENARAELDQLQQEAATRRNLYQTLLERAQQTATQPGGAETPDVRVLATATPPVAPSGPNIPMASGLGGVGGIILGSLLALARVRSVEGFASSGEVTAVTGLPVAAALPRASGRRGNTLPARVLSAPDGPEAEAMRTLRARLRRLGRSGTPRSVVFTSVGEAGDASQVAAAFARTAAADGERVLLIEGDLYAKQLGRLLAAPVDGQQHAFTAPHTDWHDALQCDSQDRLDLLLTHQQQHATDESAFLGSVYFQNLLVQAREEYDLVVMDCPRAESSDALTLVHRADVGVLVINGRRTSRTMAQDAAASLGAVSRFPLLALLLVP